MNTCTTIMETLPTFDSRTRVMEDRAFSVGGNGRLWRSYQPINHQPDHNINMEMYRTYYELVLSSRYRDPCHTASLLLTSPIPPHPGRLNKKTPPFRHRTVSARRHGMPTCCLQKEPGMSCTLASSLAYLGPARSCLGSGSTKTHLPSPQ